MSTPVRVPRWQQGEPLRAVRGASRLERVPLGDSGEGTYQNNDVIYRVDARGAVEWVYPRRCDHAGGQLCVSPDGSRATCPLHAWDLDLGSGRYRNVDVSKTRLDFEVKDGELVYESADEVLVIPASATGTPGAAGVLSLRFLAHAAFEISMGGFSLVLDPWLLGPCFLGGWWLDPPPKSDAMDRLLESDALFLSHNHPDHMHPETLSHLPTHHPALVPAFASGSAARSARRLGLQALQSLEFNTLYHCDDAPFALAVLRASGFRDDSGLLVVAGARSVLFTVDSSALNGYVLPRPVDLLFTSFAGGASGYPLCFEQYPVEERLRIARRHAAGLRHEVATLIGATAPRAVVPYAGYFNEAGSGDRWIREHNVHNSVEDIRVLAERLVPEGLVIDPRERDAIALAPGGELSSCPTSGARAFELDAEYVQRYEANFARREAAFELEDARNYFANARFRDDLVVSVLPTNRDFEPVGRGLVVDFRGAQPQISEGDPSAIQTEFDEASTPPRRLEIRARREALAEAIRSARPLEELSIGFGSRFRRNPDHYNSGFWNYFTNLYPE